MKTIIFKSEKKAKNYEIIAAKAFHIYSAGELLWRVKTDKIEELIDIYNHGEIIVKEIN
jgi:hypothetical protein